MTYQQQQRIKCLARYAYRKARYLDGHVYPDARNDEQRALGAELEWRRNVLQNERRRAAAKEASRIARQQEATLARWSAGNVRAIR